MSYHFTANDLTDPAALGMQPHPEGGWYRELYASSETIETPRGRRPLSTAITFLLQ